jgi:hypothetical protein
VYHIAALVLTGCDPAALCNGPECADFYTRGRLSGLEAPASDTVVDVWDSSTVALYDGSSTLGNGWTSSPIEGGLIVGLPEAARAVRIGTSADDGLLAPIAQWVDDDRSSELGASVLALPSEGGGFDLWVGAPNYEDAEGVVRGAVLVFEDAANETSAQPDDAELILLGSSEGDRFGAQLTLCGPLTEDDLPEIVVWAPWFLRERVGELAGASYVVRSEALSGRSGEVEAEEVSEILWGAQPGEGAGHAVACADLGEDEQLEMLIGAPWADSEVGANDEVGRVYLLSGMPSTGVLDDSARTRLTVGGTTAGEWFGSSLAVLSHTDGPLVAVGSPGLIPLGGVATGAVRVLAGDDLMNRSAQADKPVSVDSFEGLVGLFEPNKGEDAVHFGRWVYSADLDGDLLDDLVVGAPDYHGPDGPDFDTGRLWAWFSANAIEWTTTGFTPPADVMVTGEEPFQRIGRAVSVHDSDGDNLDELWIPTGWAAP